MALEKDIATLELLLSGRDIELDELYHPAIKLGIEALKREQEWRQRWPHQSHLPFPGEAEEN